MDLHLASRIALLIHRSREREPLTPEEQAELDYWRGQPDHEALYQRLMDRSKVIAELRALEAYDADAATRSIFEALQLPMPHVEPEAVVQRDEGRERRTLSKWMVRRRWVAAAALIGLAIMAIWLLWPASTSKPVASREVKPVIPAGGNKAILTLAGGATIVLDTAKTGTLVSQAGARVLKLKDGQLAYVQQQGLASPGNATPSYNTLTTPRGGQYRLALPDGSKVWLNAASSITYPTAFAGKERKVTITGEAYFEVAQDAGRPFRVAAGGQEIQVLGTSFNVNAYYDEPAIRTTLVQGKIKVRQGPTEKLLSPGEQVQGSGTALTVTQADVEQVLAWKNGAFSFQGADLPTVMRQLARWYDIEVEYQGMVPQGTFNGEIGRDLSLDQVLDGLARTRIHYTIVNAHKIIIRP